MRAGGAETIEGHLDATGPIQNERQPFDVTWTFLDKNGRWIGESQLRYFCRCRGGDIQIELVDIIRSFRARVMPYKTAVSH